MRRLLPLVFVVTACASTPKTGPEFPPGIILPAEDLLAVVAAATTQFEAYEGGEPKQIWHARNCAVHKKPRSDAKYYACLFAGDSDDAAAAARYETLKQSLAAALPELSFNERDVDVSGCPRKMYKALDAAKKLDIYVFFDRSHCRFGPTNTLNLVVSPKEEAPPPFAQGPAKAIYEADLAFAKAVKERGVDAWVEAFAENGAQLTRKGEWMIGHEKIRELMAPVLSDGTTIDWEPKTVAVSKSGNLAMSWGRATYRSKDQEGKETVFYGDYVTVWKKMPDGGWKVLFDTGDLDETPK